MSTLLTTQDAIDYGPFDSHVSGPAIAAAIPNSEEAIFNERFGWDFYQKMLADRYTYDLYVEGEDTEGGTRYYCDWRDDIIGVDEGAFVLVHNKIYKCIRTVNRNNITPNNPDYYRLAARFKTECFEALWDRYLRPILAYTVARDGVFSRTYIETGRGAVKRYEEGKSKSLTTAELSALKNEYSGDIERMIVNMERFIRRSGSTCYALYGRTETSDCSTEKLTITPTSHQRNYGFSIPSS